MIKYLYFDLDNKDDNFLIDYFTVKEFACKDGFPTFRIDARLLCILYSIRCYFGKPLKITSAYRTRKYNEKIKGASGSAHCEGMACDFKIDVKLFDLLDFIIKNTQCRIGVYDNFIHIDTYAYANMSDRIFWIVDNKGLTNYYYDIAPFLTYLKKKGYN